MTDRVPYVPRSCDFVDVGAFESTGVDGPEGVGGRFLVWLVDDRDTVIVRAADGLAGAVEVARAYCAAWGAVVLFVEDADGALIEEDKWVSLVAAREPLPYVYTVELRSPRSDLRGVVSALWTTTVLADALRWRAALPMALRARTLVVSNAPDRPPR